MEIFYVIVLHIYALIFMIFIKLIIIKSLKQLLKKNIIIFSKILIDFEYFSSIFLTSNSVNTKQSLLFKT
jgi:hypothetical protein